VIDESDDMARAFRRHVLEVHSLSIATGSALEMLDAAGLHGEVTWDGKPRVPDCEACQKASIK
jgi:hypothetical protein